jgi:hypothetical protein
MNAEEKLKLISERLPGITKAVITLARDGREWRVSNFLVTQDEEVVLADLNFIREIINDHNDNVPRPVGPRLKIWLDEHFPELKHGNDDPATT